METVREAYHWALKDYRTYPLRFCLEVIAWIASITCSVVMTLTIPHPPLTILYSIWVFGCSIYTWAAWTRNSFGMMANYVLLTTIDTVGLIKLISL
jgi:hypothetical protein